MNKLIVFVFILIALIGAVLCDELEEQPQLLPGTPEVHHFHCEGGEGHAPHDHDDQNHLKYMEIPKFLDGGTSGGWEPLNTNEGGMGFAPKKDRDEL